MVVLGVILAASQTQRGLRVRSGKMRHLWQQTTLKIAVFGGRLRVLEGSFLWWYPAEHTVAWVQQLSKETTCLFHAYNLASLARYTGRMQSMSLRIIEKVSQLGKYRAGIVGLSQKYSAIKVIIH